MSSKNAVRIGLAVVVAYLLNIILIVAADIVFLQLMPPVHSVFRRSYLLADLIAQSVIQTVAGYVCCWIARGRPSALALLAAVGIVVGGFSLFHSWHDEPHWYGIALLAVYFPCLWLGWNLMSRRGVEVASSGP
jgi:hypothetical protein